MDQCVFAGVGKTEQEIEFALRKGIYSFNVESIPELERIDRIAGRLKKIAPISVRVNPNVDAKTHASAKRLASWRGVNTHSRCSASIEKE